MAELLQEVEIIREKFGKGVSRESLMADHSEFHKAYPRLFDITQDANFDINTLKYMISCRDKIVDSNVNEVDFEVMDKLKNIYIDSVVDKSQSTKNE